jgi:hypothetical protein
VRAVELGQNLIDEAMPTLRVLTNAATTSIFLLISRYCVDGVFGRCYQHGGLSFRNMLGSLNLVEHHQMVRSEMRVALAVIAIGLFTLPADGDGTLLSWGPRDVEGVTEASFNKSKSQTVDEILAKNPEVKTWGDTYLLVVGAHSHKEDKALLKGLVSQLTDSTEVELKGTSRLILWPRITKGQILFEGKGFQVSDDLYLVAGRANWILRQLTKKNFGYVEPTSTKEQLAELQQKWKRWLDGEKVEEAPSEYPTKEKGSSEIHSHEALEALIVSLKPSDAKEKLTKTCLKKLYNLDELPKEPGALGSLCNPDNYTFSYLSQLTGVTDAHDHVWWADWWKTNKSNLVWNPESAAFDIKQ